MKNTILSTIIITLLFSIISCDYVHVSFGKKPEAKTEQATKEPVKTASQIEQTKNETKLNNNITQQQQQQQQQQRNALAILTPEQIFNEYKESIVEIHVADYTGSPKSMGSGVILNHNGLIVTNHHVLESGVSAVVKLASGAMFPLQQVKQIDEANDLATFTIKTDLPLKPIKFGQSHLLKIGEPVIVIGNPAGLDRTLSTGNVSGFRTLFGKEDLVQFTAPISPGSSGGAVFDTKGNLIGIASMAIVGLQRTNQNLNLAIPVNVLKALVINDMNFSHDEMMNYLNNESDFLANNHHLLHPTETVQSIKPYLHFERIHNYDNYIVRLDKFRTQEIVRLTFLRRYKSFLTILDQQKAIDPDILNKLGLINSKVTSSPLTDISKQLTDCEDYFKQTYVYALFECALATGNDQLNLHYVFDMETDKSGCIEMVSNLLNSNTLSCSVMDMQNIDSACVEYSRPEFFQNLDVLRNKKTNKTYLSGTFLSENNKNKYPVRIIYPDNKEESQYSCHHLTNTFNKSSDTIRGAKCIY